MSMQNICRVIRKCISRILRIKYFDTLHLQLCLFITVFSGHYSFSAYVLNHHLSGINALSHLQNKLYKLQEDLKSPKLFENKIQVNQESK